MIKSSLARFQPESIDCETIKKDAYDNHRILVVSLDDERLNWVDIQLLKNIAELIYGNHEKQ